MQIRPAGVCTCVCLVLMDVLRNNVLNVDKENMSFLSFLDKNENRDSTTDTNENTDTCNKI